MKVVLDTNVVVSAVLFEGGRLAWVRELWTAGRIVPLASQATIQELVRVLGYPKFHLDEDDIGAVLAAYLPVTLVVTVPARSPAGLPVCRDPHDQDFLRLAAAGRAEVLVSGDRALLVLAGRTTFAIESPEVFKKRFSWAMVQSYSRASFDG